MKKLLVSSVILGMGIIGSSSASAASFSILDGWQLDTTSAGIASVNTNIGHIGLSSGNSFVDVNIGADNALSVGDTFTELGAVFSTNITHENAVGAADSGFPVNYASPLVGLQFQFSGLSGVISAVNADGSSNFTYTPGVGSITLSGTTNGTTFTTLATFSIADPSGGTQGVFLGGFVPNGTNDILGLVLNAGYTSNLFRDSTGASLDARVLAGTLLGAVHTQNTLFNTVSVTGTGAATTAHLNFQSDGSFNLATVTVPEPSSIALLGLGLLAFGFNSRSKSGFAA